MGLSVSEIGTLFTHRGGRAYEGEPVTQLEHALQCAARAEEASAPPALIAAALLHDLGHMLNDHGETPTLRGIDDRHQYAALPFLRATFDDAVLEPIRLHVDAKRYLCATRPGYADALSADSKRSLALQGGIYDAAEAAAFIARPHAADAVAVRLWDDLAKLPDAPTPPLEHFLAMLHAVVRRPGAA
jgi:phosphonate degradation associated HDIG domain protein